MKILSLVFALSILCALSSDVGAQTLTGFGTNDFYSTGSTFTTTSQDASSYHIAGTDFGKFLAGTISSTLVGSPTQLSLTGTMTINPSTSFDITLQDASFNQLIFTANWSAFTLTGVSQTIILNRTNVIGSSFGAVTGLSISTNGSGASLDFTFDALSAVPEPTSVLLLGMGLAGIAMRRSLRRR